MYKLYNGCPNDELQAVWDSRDKARADLKAVDARAWITYFPLEGGYMASTWEGEKFKSLSSKMHPSVESASREAIKILSGERE